MGTRSAVAINDGGSFKGRYIHWDGYPTGVGRDLGMLIREFGAEAVANTIVVENYGWSALQVGRGPMGTYRDDEYSSDGRFKAIEGYGMAYTEAEGQSWPEMWVTYENDFDTEWQYAIDANGDVTVYAGFNLVGVANAFDGGYDTKMAQFEHAAYGFSYDD